MYKIFVNKTNNTLYRGLAVVSAKSSIEAHSILSDNSGKYPYFNIDIYDFNNWVETEVKTDIPMFICESNSNR